MQSTIRRFAPGFLMMAIGILGWWYNWHLANTAGYFYIKLCLLAPLGIFGGFVVLLRPEWAGPWRNDATKGHKIALISVIGAMVVFSGIDMYRLKHSSPTRLSRVPKFQPRPTPSIAVRPAAVVKPAPINFLSQTYRLASFNQRQHAMWEFVPVNDNIDNWTTLLTIVDRPDARSREELDRLAEGVMSNYKSHGGQIVLAKTLQDHSGNPYNYIVAAFAQPDQQRYEFNFVKVSLGARNATIAIYGARVANAVDFLAKGKQFLTQNSGEIGAALNNLELPDTGRLPRETF